MSDLLRDPLFQLNAVLWLTQSLPANFKIRALLREHGFGVYAIAPLLALPPDVRAALATSGLQAKDRTRPDVVLCHEAKKRYAFTECKAAAFGPESSTSEQVRTLALVAGPIARDVLALAVGEQIGSAMTFVVPEDQRALLRATLSSLNASLAEKGLQGGAGLILGIKIVSGNIALTVESPEEQFFGLGAGAHTFIEVAPGNDPRPLYLIPYDPDVTQSEEEGKYCKRVLFERMQSAVLAAIGRSYAPTQLKFDFKGLINDATFGMFDLWENNESAKHMRDVTKQFMNALTRAVNTVVRESMELESASTWRVRFSTEDERTKILNGVGQFSCETLELGAPSERDLFDGIEGGSTS